MTTKPQLDLAPLARPGWTAAGANTLFPAVFFTNINMRLHDPVFRGFVAEYQYPFVVANSVVFEQELISARDTKWQFAVPAR